MSKLIITTKYMPATKRVKATHVTGGSKYHIWSNELPIDKNHELAAYDLMVKMHMSVKHKLVAQTRSMDTIVWRMVKR